jgi:hypothetical protein
MPPVTLGDQNCEDSNSAQIRSQMSFWKATDVAERVRQEAVDAALHIKRPRWRLFGYFFSCWDEDRSG